MGPNRTRSTSERFWSKVAGGDVTTCWTWTGSHNESGYGTLRLPSGRFMGAHRFAFEDLITEIPAELVLDHNCQNPSCVNPWHLEPVTQQENILRSGCPAALNAIKTRCSRGHLLAEDNVYRAPASPNKRQCRTCHRERQREYKASKGGAR